MFNLNDIENQFKQHEKEAYIANRVVNRLFAENCTQSEYREILRIVEERILGKHIYDALEFEK